MRSDISIIITSYNVERYIERAVRSALSQTGVTLEIIIVDDASTDQTWPLVSRISDPRIRTVRLDINSGPGAARNAGIAQAGGEWLAVLDSDDEYAPGRLERCLKLARARGADIVVDNLCVTPEAGGAEFPMFPSAFYQMGILTLPAFIKGKLTSNNNYTLGYLKPIFRSVFLQKHALLYDTDLRIGEDYLLMADALAKGAICVIDPHCGYRYTARAGSISHRLTPGHIAHMLRADATHLARCPLPPLAAREQRKRTRGLHILLAYALLVDALKQGDGKAALTAVLSRPSCVWLLWEPVWVRVRRCFGGK